MEKTSLDKTLEWLSDVILNKKVIAPSQWLDVAQRVNVLVGTETDRLAEIHQKLAKLQSEMIEAGSTVSKAKISAEATDDYVEYQKTKAKIERVEETIRLAKVQARMKDGEYGRSGF